MLILLNYPNSDIVLLELNIASYHYAQNIYKVHWYMLQLILLGVKVLVHA